MGKTKNVVEPSLMPCLYFIFYRLTYGILFFTGYLQSRSKGITELNMVWIEQERIMDFDAICRSPSKTRALPKNEK